jgi:ABC-2 type transport system permease protein
MPRLRQIKGPVAFGGNARHQLQLLWLLASTDLKLRYRGSLLGWAWTLIRPLALFGILYLVFTRVIRFGGEIQNYALVLLLSIVLFQFFSDVTNTAVSAIPGREALVRHARLPRALIPFSVVLGGLMNLGLNMVPIVVLALLAGIDPRWTRLLMPLIALGLVILCAALALLLSATYVRLRDTAPIWAVISRALFYASPVLYPVEFVPDSLRGMLLFNPLAPLLAEARVWFIDPSAPTAAEAVGGTALLLVPLGITLALCVLGAVAFSRRARTIAEEL